MTARVTRPRLSTASLTLRNVLGYYVLGALLQGALAILVVEYFGSGFPANYSLAAVIVPLTSPTALGMVFVLPAYALAALVVAWRASMTVEVNDAGA